MLGENPTGVFGQYTECMKVARVPTLPEPENKPGLREGERSINADELRCWLLLEKRPDIGGNRATLDLENWFDCRVFYVPSPDTIINEALTKLGYGRLTGDGRGSFFDKLAAELEDSQHAKEAGPLIALLNMVSSIPRQGTLERASFEQARKMAMGVTLDAIADLIKSNFPGAAGGANTAIKIIRNTVDIAIATGEYMAEYLAVRAEAARRYYSTQRRDFVQQAYNKVFGLPAGTNVASSTVAAWCRYGNEKAKIVNSAYAYLSAPDGTDGEAKAQEAEVMLLSAGLKDYIKSMVGHFKGDWRRMFATSGILAAWVASYKREDVHPDAWREDMPQGYPGYGNNSIMRYIGVAANEGKDAWPLWRDIGTGTVGSTPGKFFSLPDKNQAPATTLYAKIGAPRMIDVWWANYGLRPGTESGWNVQRYGEVLRLAAASMYAYYPPKTLGKKHPFNSNDVWSELDTSKSPKLTDGFAADVWEVWKLWKSFIEGRFPYKGRMNKWNEFAKIMRDRVFDFFRVAADGAFLDGTDAEAWTRRIIYLFTGNVNLATKPKANEKVRPCPTDGTACLPCAVIKDRLPIGAKSFPIPMLIEYSGSTGRLSPEFKAWAETLASKGYPGYYIDCLADEVTFKSKKSKTSNKGGRGADSAAAKYTSAAARDSYVAAKATYTPSLYNGLSSASGLTAPRVAELQGADIRNYPPLIPELRGITRPMTIEKVRKG